MGMRTTIYVAVLLITCFSPRGMTDETFELTSRTPNASARRRHPREKKTAGASADQPPSKKQSSGSSLMRWLASYYTCKPSLKNVTTSKTGSTLFATTRATIRSCICTHILCKSFLIICGLYLMMYLRPDYSIHVRNAFEGILKKFNLTSEEFRLRPGQRLAQYRQPSMPIIIIPGIISTGLELWQGTECATGKFRHRFWTSMQMVNNIGRDHQCWLKHISLNLSTWYDGNDSQCHRSIRLFRVGAIRNPFVCGQCWAGRQPITCT